MGHAKIALIEYKSDRKGGRTPRTGKLRGPAARVRRFKRALTRDGVRFTESIVPVVFVEQKGFPATAWVHVQLADGPL